MALLRQAVRPRRKLDVRVDLLLEGHLEWDGPRYGYDMIRHDDRDERMVIRRIIGL